MKNNVEKKASSGVGANVLLLIGAIIALLSIVFAVQNAEPTQVEFFKWSFSLPLALLVVASISTGVLLAVLFSLPTWWKKSRQIARLRKELKNLGKSTNKMVKENDHLQTQVERAEVEKEV